MPNNIRRVFILSLVTSVMSLSPSHAFADAAPLSSDELLQMVSPKSIQYQPPSAASAEPYKAGVTNTDMQTSAGPSVSSSVSKTSSESEEAESVQPYPGQAELQIKGDYDASPSSNPTGGTNYGIETTLYSAPIDDKWRLFAGEYYTHEVEPVGEGSIGLARSSAGVEYHDNLLLADFAPTYNLYKGTERVGATGDASFDVSKDWTVGGGAQLFSRDVPLRALNAGVTANSYDANASWYQSSLRFINFDANVMTLSDDNVRSAFTGAYTEHLFNSSRYTIDGLANLTESQNSKNENTLYYTPTRDVQGLVGGRVTQPLYDDSHFLYEHSLEVTPGIYWEQGYGSSPALNAIYQQKLHDVGLFDAGLGVDFSRQTYDGGAASNSITLLFDLSERF